MGPCHLPAPVHLRQDPLPHLAFLPQTPGEQLCTPTAPGCSAVPTAKDVLTLAMVSSCNPFSHPLPSHTCPYPGPKTPWREAELAGTLFVALEGSVLPWTWACCPPICPQTQMFLEDNSQKDGADIFCLPAGAPTSQSTCCLNAQSIPCQPTATDTWDNTKDTSESSGQEHQRKHGGGSGKRKVAALDMLPITPAGPIGATTWLNNSIPEVS